MSASLKIVDCYPPDPELTSKNRPQCECPLNPELVEHQKRWEEFHGRGWYKNGKPGKPKGTCANKARYKVNGKWACRKHAGLILLDALAIVEKRR